MNPRTTENSFWKNYGNTILSGLMSVCILFTGFFLNQAWGKLNEVERNVQKLEVQYATSHATNFSIQDATAQKALLDAVDIQLDRRATRLEENMSQIKDSLQEIKQAVKEKNNP